MKKLQSKKTRILLALLLCVSLAITGVFACPWDDECDGPDTCHTWESEDGPVHHHTGPYYHFKDSGTIEPGDPDFCPGDYLVIVVKCEECQEYLTDHWDFPPQHDYILHCTDPDRESTWYWECTSCGNTAAFKKN